MSDEENCSHYSHIRELRRLQAEAGRASHRFRTAPSSRGDVWLGQVRSWTPVSGRELCFKYELEAVESFFSWRRATGRNSNRAVGVGTGSVSYLGPPGDKPQGGVSRRNLPGDSPARYRRPAGALFTIKVLRNSPKPSFVVGKKTDIL